MVRGEIHFTILQRKYSYFLPRKEIGFSYSLFIFRLIFRLTYVSFITFKLHVLGFIWAHFRWQERIWIFNHLEFYLLWGSFWMVSMCFSFMNVYLVRFQYLNWNILQCTCCLRHRMNCLSADVEDSAYVVKKHAQNKNYVQLSDFIFWRGSHGIASF